MRVSLLQVASPDAEKPHKRRERVGELIADAAGSDLVMLPELWLPGYFAFDRYEASAEPLDGDTVLAGGEWARQLGCYIHLGCLVERSTDGQLHNTAVVLDPSGSVALTYRKVHLFHHESREAALLVAGDSTGVISTPFGNLATTTCYDLRFPELWRTMLDAGAESVLVASAWPAARRDHWRLFTSCRALEEQVFVLGCNAAGSHGGVELGGCSRVVDPRGVLLAEAGEGEEILTCEVDSAAVGAARAEFPALRDRRWEPIRVDVTPDAVIGPVPTRSSSVAR